MVRLISEVIQLSAIMGCSLWGGSYRVLSFCDTFGANEMQLSAKLLMGPLFPDRALFLKVKGEAL